MNLSSSDVRWKSALILYYDYEFSGNIRNNFGSQCSIHQIAARSKSDRFFCRINPYLSKEQVEPPVHPKYSMPSKDEFKELEADSFCEAYDKFLGFVLRLLLKRKKEWVCLISHNGFRSDKIVLEHELSYHKLQPYPFYFMDSLLYIREVHPGLQSYSLENVFKSLFPEKSYKAHDAEMDTDALYAIVQKLNKPLHGVLYPMLTIPWRNISGIGYHSEQGLLMAGFSDIISFYLATRGSRQRTIECLIYAGVVSTEKLIENIFHWYKLAETMMVYREQNALCRSPPPPA
jgi:DNA polymerase III epsilon subunit-like protein